MNKVDKIAVYIPDEEAKKFIVFQQYYVPFSLLIEKKVFEQKNASVTLHFDPMGVLQTIERRDFLFNARFDTK